MKIKNIVAILGFFSLFAPPIYAQENPASAAGKLADNYRSEVVAEFTFAALGSSSGVYQFTLTNTNPVKYVKNYQLVFPGTNLANLVVVPQGEEIDKNIKEANGQTLVELAFANDLVGQGKKRHFNVEMSAHQLLKNRGENKVITIPPLGETQHFASYILRVRVPTSWGVPKFSHQVQKSSVKAGEAIYEFDQSLGETISLVYGQEQYLQFTYEGVIENKANSAAYSAYQFPSDSGEVAVWYQSISPEPTVWKLNSAHTWQAYYLLSAGQKTHLYAQGYLVIKNPTIDFQASNYFPYLSGNFNAWHIEQIPDEIFNLNPEEKIQVNLNLHQFGIFPVLNYYQINLFNNSPKQINGLKLQLQAQGAQGKIIYPLEEISLLGWQKLAIIAALTPESWWLPYQQSELVLTISHENKLIQTIVMPSLLISYPAFALMGLLCAVTITTGSVLVARRKKARALRRESQKLKKSP